MRRQLLEFHFALCLLPFSQRLKIKFAQYKKFMIYYRFF